MGQHADVAFDNYLLALEEGDYENCIDVMCKYCHAFPLDWEETPEGWRLFTQKRHILHKCKAFRNRNLAGQPAL
jgi:hypothetical protein